MNSGYGTTAYFTSESDARRAAEDLRAQGFDVDVHTEGTHGQNFWDAIKNFFSGETDYQRYGSGTIVKINGGDAQTIETIVQQYNGRLSGGDIAGMSAGTSSSVTGTTASQTGGLVENESDYQRTRTMGTGGTGAGNPGTSSTTGDVPNID